MSQSTQTVSARFHFGSRNVVGAGCEMRVRAELTAHTSNDFIFLKRYLAPGKHYECGSPDLKRLLIGRNSEGPGRHAIMTRIIDFHTKNRASYTYELDPVGHTIKLKDIGDGKTVASDLENVVEDLVERGYSVDQFSIRYQDSSGSWAQVLTANSGFSGFVSA